MEACRYISDQVGSDNTSETVPKAVERVRQIAEYALYPDDAVFVYHSEIDPLPGPDDPNLYDEELAAQWEEGYAA